MGLFAVSKTLWKLKSFPKQEELRKFANSLPRSPVTARAGEAVLFGSGVRDAMGELGRDENKHRVLSTGRRKLSHSPQRTFGVVKQDVRKQHSGSDVTAPRVESSRL